MVQKQIITHFTDDDLYKLSMCCAVIDNFPRAQVKYEFVDRNKTVYPKGFADEVRHQQQFHRHGHQRRRRDRQEGRKGEYHRELYL